MRFDKRRIGWSEGTAILILAVLMAAGTSPVGAQSTPSDRTVAMFRGNPEHPGVFDTRGVERFGGIAWRFETGSAVRTAPTVSGDVVYFGSMDGHLYAVDANSGAELWRAYAGAGVGGGPLVTSDRVVFIDRANRIHAVDRSSGDPLWTVETGEDLPLPWGYEGWDYVLPSPILVGETVLAGSGNGSLYALRLSDGAEEWRFRTEGRVRSTPVVYDGAAYIGSGDGVIYGVSLERGTEVWRFETRGVGLNSADFGFDRRQIQSSATIADGTMWIGSRDASLYSIDLGTREVRWSYEEGTSWVAATPILHDGKIFSARSGSRTVRALDARSGEVLWNYVTQGFVLCSPAYADGTVYIGSEDGRIYAVNAEDGAVRWSYATGGSIYGMPAVQDGMLYVGSDDGYLYAIRGTDGASPQRAVYWDDALMPKSIWGRFEAHKYLRDYFAEAGYEVIDGEGLRAFLEARIEDGAPSVVVFGMDGLPPEVADAGQGASSLLRRYLADGGKAVWVGPYPPLIVVRDAAGTYQGTDRGRTTGLLGVDYTPWNGDSYGGVATQDGRRWGLERGWSGNPSIAMSDDVTVLALDELGRPLGWVKRFGGPVGSGWVSLQGMVDRNRLGQLRAVAEYGVFRKPVANAR